MRKILTFCLMICIVLSSGILFACGGNSTPIDLTIANFEQYTTISVGVASDQTDVSRMSANTVYASSRTDKKPQLIGRRADGTFERIQFEEKEGDFTNSWGIQSVLNLGNFTIIRYLRGYTGEIYSYNSLTSGQDYVFALDKRSGKMYGISSPGSKERIMNVVCASDNHFIAADGGALSNKLIKYTVVDGKLEVKEIFDRDKLHTFYSFKTDRYGHVYSTWGDQYMLTNDGVLKEFENVKIAKNGIAYIGNQWVNAQGELEEATFVPTTLDNLNFDGNTYIAEEYLLLQQDNVSYYRQPSSNKIYKYTFVNDIEYTVDIIQLEKYQQHGVLLNKKLYFLNDREVYYVDIDSGKYTTLNSEYFFNSIYANNQGEIIFEGIDNRLNDVKGVIKADNTVEIGIEPKEYEIYYIEPIN